MGFNNLNLESKCNVSYRGNALVQGPPGSRRERVIR